MNELSMKKDKKLPNLKVPVKGKKGVSKYMRKKVASQAKDDLYNSVQSADKKPEKYIKPDGKVGIRMVKTDKEVIKKEAMSLDQMMRMRYQAAASQKKNQKKTDDKEKKKMAAKADMDMRARREMVDPMDLRGRPTKKDPYHGKTKFGLKHPLHPLNIQKRKEKEAKKAAVKKEAVEYPHMMYDPKTGNEVKAKTPADHNKYAKMGYTHEKPKVDEASMSPMNLKRAEKFMGPSKNFNQAVNLVSKGMKVSRLEAMKMVKKILGVNPKTNKIESVDEAIKNLSSADQVKAAIKIIRDKRFNMRSQIDKKTAIQKISKDLLKDPKVKKEMDKIYEENVEEALTLQQRMKRSRLMKRMKTRIKIGRERAKRKMANKDKLLRRARRQARDQIARKLTRGIPKKELTFARKKEIEKRLEKPALQARINRIAKRMFKDVRKAEVQRKKG